MWNRPFARALRRVIVTSSRHSWSDASTAELARGGAAEEGAEDRLHHVLAVHAAGELAAEVLLGDPDQLAGVAVEHCLGGLRVAGAEAVEEFGGRSGLVHGYPSGRNAADILPQRGRPADPTVSFSGRSR